MDAILIYTYIFIFYFFLSEKFLSNFAELLFIDTQYLKKKKKKVVEHVSGICNSFSIMFSTMI